MGILDCGFRIEQKWKILDLAIEGLRDCGILKIKPIRHSGLDPESSVFLVISYWMPVDDPVFSGIKSGMTSCGIIAAFVTSGSVRKHHLPAPKPYPL